MRTEDGMDQAEGLRRLLVMNQTQVVTVLAARPRVGRTSATINLAAALAHSGKAVLVLDENQGPNNLLEGMGFSDGLDLLDVAQGKCGSGDAVRAAMGFGVLSTARAMRALSRLDQASQQRLEYALTEVADGAEVVLVDAAIPAMDFSDSGRAAVISPSLASGAALLVIVEATPCGITESYALIKRLTLNDTRQQFGILVNKAVNEQAAVTVFENMAKVARRNLSVRLEYLGRIPPNARQAPRSGRPAAEKFLAAATMNAYLELAQKLLRLPMQRDEIENGASAVIQNLMRQASPAFARYCATSGAR